MLLIALACWGKLHIGFLVIIQQFLKNTRAVAGEELEILLITQPLFIYQM